MINQDYESTIVNELSQYTGCTVVLANQTAPMPPYPYISYTIITPVRAVGGTYCDQKTAFSISLWNKHGVLPYNLMTADCAARSRCCFTTFLLVQGVIKSEKMGLPLQERLTLQFVTTCLPFNLNTETGWM